ncbi:MAG: hypothetical protein AAF919_18080 [Pseudomonadota bacterium]
MTRFSLSTVLAAALSVPLALGAVPAAADAESADRPLLITQKSDRGSHPPKAEMIFTIIADEQDN